MVTIDCADPDELASWWAAAIGGTVHAVYPGWFVIVGAQPISMGFQKVPEAKMGKNRLHVDFSVDDRQDAVPARRLPPCDGIRQMSIAR